MTQTKKRDSQPQPRHVRPYGGRSMMSIERRGPRAWSRDQRAAFLHHLSVQDTLEQALRAARVPRVEAYAERVRSKVFARAWDRCVADRMARLPEALLDHVIEGLRAGPDAKEATVRQAASIGQWLLERCLPALSETTPRARVPRAVAGAAAMTERKPAPAPEPGKTDRDLAAKIAAVRARLAEVAAAPAPAPEEAAAAGDGGPPESAN